MQTLPHSPPGHRCVHALRMCCRCAVSPLCGLHEASSRASQAGRNARRVFRPRAPPPSAAQARDRSGCARAWRRPALCRCGTASRRVRRSGPALLVPESDENAGVLVDNGAERSVHARSGVVGALWLTHCMHACEVHACAGTADVPAARRSALPQNDTECSARTSRWPAVGAARQPPPIPTAAPRPARARLASCTRTPGGACMQECMRAPPRRPCGVSPAVVGAARQPLPSTHRGPSSRPRATGRRAHAYRVDGPTYPSGWCSFRSFGGLRLEVAGRVGGRCSERFPTKKKSRSVLPSVATTEGRKKCVAQ